MFLCLNNGGTAPDFTGKNQINPMAAIGAAQMMLSHLGFTQAAKVCDEAMQHVFLVKSQAVGEMGYSTSEIGDMVVHSLSTVNA